MGKRKSVLIWGQYVADGRGRRQVHRQLLFSILILLLRWESSGYIYRLKGMKLMGPVENEGTE